MRETSLRLPDTLPWCYGYGVDFGCSDDPHPAARVLVDTDQKVHEQFSKTHEVHIRDIDRGFSDWAGRQFDFVYSSHLLEHLRDPHAFLRTCCQILKPGGKLVLVLPDEDFYWPNGHPLANPDHKWWHLNPMKVYRWAVAAFKGRVRCVSLVEASAPEGGKWGFVVVYEKLAEPEPSDLTEAKWLGTR